MSKRDATSERGSAGTPDGAPDRVGTIPVWKLHGRPSASADAARVAQLRRVLALTPRERVLGALELGLQLKARGR